MNVQKSEDLLSTVLPNDLPASPSSQQLFGQDQQDEEASDCPLLTPSPPPDRTLHPLEIAPIFNPLEGTPLEMTPTPTMENINSEDGLNAYMNIVMLNSSSKPLNDEPSSRDPMVESSSSGSSSDNNEPVCAQLLNQLNTAYQHLAPDAQALENGGKPPLVGIQLAVPKTSKNYRFMTWNWPLIRKTCFWSLMSILAGCTALVIGVIATMPKRCDPPVEWWQGSLFYEIFPASFQDSSKGGDGMGDLLGIVMRLDYLKNLGVQGIRLNSIFPAPHYPEHYSNITNLTAVNSNLGTLDDFSTLIREVHQRNMSLILDLPLYPFVQNFEEENPHPSKRNGTDKAVRERRDTSALVLPDMIPTQEPNSFHSIRSVLTSVPPPMKESKVDSADLEELVTKEHHVVTTAIEFWLRAGVDGFYLKGLEKFVEEKNFGDMLKSWKTLVGPNRILMCHVNALKNATAIPARNALLNRIDLIDVILRVSNGTKDIRTQVESITKGILFEKPGYPWVHWSIGSIDTKRVASTLNARNSSIATILLEMMLPGTPSIFYGDEVGMVDCNCEDHQDLAHVHNSAPMFWDKIDGSEDKFSSKSITPWLPEHTVLPRTSLTGTIAEMAKLRTRTTQIYVKAVYKDNQATTNCDIRYTADELIVIERWYPRRNSHVLVANLGKETLTKDLSSLYYGGHVIVGSANRLDRDVYFKGLTIAPGEAFIIKLDK